jgi:phage/plasmid-associated DNA primase
MKKLAFDTLKHLKINKGVKRATNEYQDEEDELREFIEERCVLGDSHFSQLCGCSKVHT